MNYRISLQSIYCIDTNTLQKQSIFIYEYHINIYIYTHTSQLIDEPTWKKKK